MPRRDSFQYKQFIRKNIGGMIFLLSLGILFAAFDTGQTAESIVVMETIPYTYGQNQKQTQRAFKLNPDDSGLVALANQETADTEETEGVQVHLTSTIGADEITYQPETDIELTSKQVKEALTSEDIDRLRNLDFLKQNFYIVDKRTQLTAQDFNVGDFLKKDLTIDNSISGPKVLIFHTHSSEGFADSDMSDPMNGIMGAGEKLAELLENEYGIETLHHMGRYDIVDGKSQILGAYERMEPDIRKILEENPSIQMVIDMHRDGVAEGTRLVKNINGKDCAQIMFFNGLCKLNKNGELTPIAGLENPYIGDNLALSFNMQLMANRLYPQLTRKIYLNAYRYSLHMLPKSMLIEVGAQTNTRQEVDNSMELLAEIIAGTLLKE